MEKNERIIALEEAQDLINQAIDLIHEAVADTDEARSADAYILAHLDNWANGNNQYDQHIPNIIESINDQE